MSESHREKRKYRGTGFLLAASLVGTGAIIGLSSPAVAQSTAETPIVGDKPDTAGNGLMNYAINLSEDSTDADLQTAQDAVEDLDAELLHSWNQIHVFFAQSDDDKFGTNVAEALDKAGVALDSVGPTRQAPVEDYEVRGETTEKKLDAQALRSKGDAANTEGQFEKERKLEAAADDDAESWGVQAIGADEARDVDVKKEKVVVGILDSGVESSHPDLKDSFSEDLSVDCAVNGIPSQDDRSNGEKAWYPDLGDTGDYHGMHVNGTVASTNSGIGVAPDATAASVRVYQGDFANPEHVTCGFMWAGEHNFDVTNNSYYVDPWEHWLENEPQQAAGLESVTRAVKWSQDQGVLHVAAAGNEDTDLDNITGDEESPNDVDEDESGVSHIRTGR
jgi:subtilisin family serine protease